MINDIIIRHQPEDQTLTMLPWCDSGRIISMQVLYCLIGLIALAAFVPDAAGQLLPQGTATPRRGELVMKESNFVRMVPQQGPVDQKNTRLDTRSFRLMIPRPHP